MLKYLLLLAACYFAITHPAQAQILWQQGMGTATQYEESAGFVAVPGGYVSVGKGGSDQLAGSGHLPNQFFTSKVSASGAVLWQKSTSLTSRNVKGIETSGAAADASSGQFYATGECVELVQRHTGPSYSFGLLARFTATGDTLWTRVLYGSTQTSQAHYSKAVVTADGGVVLLGGIDTEQFVAKFSSAGQELWHQSYTTSNRLSGYFYALTLLQGGNFLVHQDKDIATNQPSRYLLLDSQGQLVSSHPTRSFLPHYAMSVDQGGNVLDAARRLYKLSPVGDTLWSRQYTQYGRLVDVRRAVETPSGQYLLAGDRYNGTDEDLSLLLVSKQTGAVLRDTLLVRVGGTEYPTGLYFDAQGNYVVGGWTIENGPLGKADQFAVLLRNWNRLLPTRASQAAALAWEVYPNPASTSERVRVVVAGAAYTGAYEVRDALGQLVRAGAALPAQGLPVAGLPAGLYLLRLREGEQWLPARRVQVMP